MFRVVPEREGKSSFYSSIISPTSFKDTEEDACSRTERREGEERTKNRTSAAKGSDRIQRHCELEEELKMLPVMTQPISFAMHASLVKSIS
jgi:hypothetical protein